MAAAMPFRAEVHDGVVTLASRVHETALIALATRLTRAVPGVVDVRCALVGMPRHPDLDPDPAGCRPAGQRPAWIPTYQARAGPSRADAGRHHMTVSTRQGVSPPAVGSAVRRAAGVM
ncbi:hypothetical protein ACWFR5_19450 [Streptomyces sp. NPDC055092]